MNEVVSIIDQGKERLMHVTRMLRQLEREVGNLALLISLQEELISRIMQEEAAVAKLREEVRDLNAQLHGARRPRAEADALRRQIEERGQPIEDHQYLKFIWKCFGDAIAYTYLDKFALKHAFYETSDYTVKQDAGALSGKEGLTQEWAVVEAFRKKGIPAILCDITNTLRHGDVCALVGPDPKPIEVKTGHSSSRRIRRQIEDIRKLSEFYEKDEASNFRGVPHVTRAEFTVPEITHVDSLNRCIQESKGKAGSFISPEPGLIYLCIREAGGSDQLFAEITARNGFLQSLNEVKRKRLWAPFQPFILSIRDPEDLYGFISGDYVLSVIVDWTELEKQFLAKGFQSVVRSEDSYLIWLRHRESESVIGISEQMFGRMIFEFQSLNWFVEVNAGMSHDIDRQLSEETEARQDGKTVQKSWFGEIPESLCDLFGTDNKSSK